MQKWQINRHRQLHSFNPFVDIEILITAALGQEFSYLNQQLELPVVQQLHLAQSALRHLHREREEEVQGL